MYNLFYVNYIYVCMYMLSHSLMCNSLQPFELQPAKLLCP